MSEIFEKLVGASGRISLSDSQTSAKFTFKSQGLHHLFRNAIRMVVKGDMADEAAVW